MSWCSRCTLLCVDEPEEDLFKVGLFGGVGHEDEVRCDGVPGHRSLDRVCLGRARLDQERGELSVTRLQLDGSDAREGREISCGRAGDATYGNADPVPAEAREQLLGGRSPDEAAL